MTDNHLLRNLSLLIALIIIGGIFGTFIGFALVEAIFHVDLMANVQLLNIEKMDSSFGPMLKFLQVIQVVFSFIIPSQLYIYIRARNREKEFIPFQGTKAISFVLGIALVLFSGPFISFLSSINENISLPSPIQEYMAEQDKQNALFTDLMLTANNWVDLMINLLVVAFLAAFSEEILFRGVLQKILTSSIQNIHLAIFLGACAFSFFHFQWSAFMPRLALGLFLGYAMAYTKSIWVPIVMHLFNNGTAVLLDYLYKRKLTSIDPNSNEYFGFMGVAISLLLIVGIYWYSQKHLLHGKRLG